MVASSIDVDTVTGIPVCIFAKSPVPGKVKTRLALSIGDGPAASLAVAMLCDVWSVVSDAAGVMPVLAAAEEGSFPVSARENFWLQGPGELGFRIEQILRRGLSDAPAAIALGADSPLLTPAHVNDALHQLETSDAVIGPCCDGGFYLLGLHHCPPGLLQNVPWSTAETCEKTARQLRSQGMSVCQLEVLSDVDTLPDLHALYNLMQEAPPEIAPFTRQWFAREFEWLAS
ncbi:MAG: TIGR04282 family arsenosugar biosynthesis glycosyltransferase [Acidobacteriota bacterium]|nr:TIGR04282 family arsenosugar biosynthesis glycosyltransferase [Acidobacteriota bacterium]